MKNWGLKKKNFRLYIVMCCVSIGIFFIALYVVTTKEHFGGSKEENEVNTYVHCTRMVKNTTQDSIRIEYPCLDGEDGVSLKINEQIFHILFDDCLEDDAWTDRANITYDITYMDEKILSIYFSGEKQKGISADGGNFEIGLNFNLENGDLLCLADFYSMEEYQNLITNAAAQDKIRIDDEILAKNKNECITFINSYFIDYFTGDSSYIYETTNFFIREGKLCFLAEPLPSMNQLTIIEMDIDSFVPSDNIKQIQMKQMIVQKETSQGEAVLPNSIFTDGNIVDLGNHIIAYCVPNNESISSQYGSFANDFTGHNYVAIHDIDQNEIFYLPDIYEHITKLKMESAGELVIKYADGKSGQMEEVHIPVIFSKWLAPNAVDVMSFDNRCGKLIISSQNELQSDKVGLPETVWTERALLGEQMYDIAFERISPVYDIGLITGGLYADYRLTVKDAKDDVVAEKVLVNYPVVYEEVHWLMDVSGDGSADIVFAFSDDWGMDALNGRTSLLTLIWKQDTRTYEATMFPWLWQEQDGASGEWKCPLWNQELSSLISFTGKDRYGRLIMDMYCFLNGEWRRVRRLQACYDGNEYPASESPSYLGYYERIYSEAGDIVEETPIDCETGAVWFDEGSCWSRYNENNLQLFPDNGWELRSSDMDGVKIDKIIKNSINQIVVGEDFLLVLYDDGSVWSWGNNEERKLGIAENFVSEPQRIEGLNHVVKLEDGGENVFALTEQGDVYTWGVKENVLRMKQMDSCIYIDTPFIMQDLKNIVDITAENGKLYALNKDGSLYVSDYPWVYGSFTNFSPIQEDVMLGEIGCMQAGAGNYDYFVRTDGSIFSLMSFFYEGYNSNAYAFIFPHEGEVEPGKNNVIAWPPLPEDIPEITVLSEGGKYECLIYYDLKGVEGVKTVSSDPYTVFLSKENGTLYYWNSDRIKYHDKEFVLTHPDTLREQCNGEFVEIRVADILDIDDAASGCPQIISIKSGKENTMFLTDDGQVFISKYVTYDTADVEYGLWQVANPGRDPQTDTYYDMALKELTFQKLELTDIQSIWTNGENCFCAVDSGGGYYRIIIEDNIITQTSNQLQ